MTTRERILRSLESSPLYLGALELVVGGPASEIRTELRQLEDEGRVELAREIGPKTYRLVPADPLGEYTGRVYSEKV